MLVFAARIRDFGCMHLAIHTVFIWSAILSSSFTLAALPERTEKEWVALCREKLSMTQGLSGRQFASIYSQLPARARIHIYIAVDATHLMHAQSAKRLITKVFQARGATPEEIDEAVRPREIGTTLYFKLPANRSELLMYVSNPHIVAVTFSRKDLNRLNITAPRANYAKVANELADLLPLLATDTQEFRAHVDFEKPFNDLPERSRSQIGNLVAIELDGTKTSALVLVSRSHLRTLANIPGVRSIRLAETTFR